jgi:hypothetical protein
MPTYGLNSCDGDGGGMSADVIIELIGNWNKFNLIAK